MRVQKYYIHIYVKDSQLRDEDRDSKSKAKQIQVIKLERQDDHVNIDYIYDKK